MAFGLNYPGTNKRSFQCDIHFAKIFGNLLEDLWLVMDN
jgi:hypothetical protein